MKTIIYIIVSFFVLPLFAQTTEVVILENGQRPQMNRWSVEGPMSSETGIDYVSSEKQRGSVVKLSGYGLNNRFVFRGEKGASLKVLKPVLQWKMKYKEPFIVDVEITTNEGPKHLLYSDLNEKVNNDDSYLHIGIGTRYNDGNWHTVTRNIQSDLHSMIPDVKLKSVDAISFRGTGFVDDIKAMDKKPVDVVVTSVSLGSKNWKRIGKGGKFDIDYDTALGEVFKFDSGTTNTVFQLKKISGSWDLTMTPIVQWKMKMQSDYKIYLIVESTKGKYILVYDDNNQSKLYDPKTKMIHYGLGYYSVDNQWHVITRDIDEDLKRVFPNADPIRIGGVLIRCKGVLSEISLLPERPVNSEAAKGWDIYDNDPKGTSLKASNDLEKGEVTEFYGDSLKNGFRYSGQNGSLQESAGKPFVKWDIKFSEVFDAMFAVESDGVVRYVHYVPMPTDYIRIKDGELYIGLGDTKTDRRWHTIVRDLSVDVKLLVKDAGYTACKYFLVRGSGKIGKIEFFDKLPEPDKSVVSSASASIVIGQYDFGHSLKNLWGDQALKNNGINAPYAVAVDPKGGIYVSDSANNRIMYWSKIPEIYGANAEVVLSKGFNNPTGLFIDKEKLFIADTGNNRVVGYSLPLDEDSIPRLVLDKDLKEPKAVFYDGTRFFVSDTGNNRVLIWNGVPAGKGRPFDVVLGQSNVKDVLPNKGKPEPNYNTMSAPVGLFSDGTSLYVSDTANNRILLFKAIPTMNGWHADVVIGQDKFKAALPNKGGKASEDSFKMPENILIYDGKLYVCDTGNNRVLFFDLSKENYSAVGIIGQPTFKLSGANSPTGIPNSATLYSPTAIAVKDGILYISDKGNNRVLVY